MRCSAPLVHRLFLLAAILTAFAIRLHALGAESLWYDETVSVHLARLPLAAMVAHTAGDIHPPGYYALLHAWQLLATPSLAGGLEFLYAYPSLFFGVLAVPMLLVLGRRLLGQRTGLAAAWLGAFAPFLVWYSQEVRMYTLGAFLGLLCLWALLKVVTPPPTATESPEPRGAAANIYGFLAVYVVAAAAGLYTLYYFLFLLVALNAIALLYLWGDWDAPAPSRARRTLLWLGAQAAILLLWLLWLPTFWRQATEPPVPPWRVPWDSVGSLLAGLSETFAALLVGQAPPGGAVLSSFGPPLGSPHAAGAAWPWALITLLVLGATLFLAVTRAGRRTTGRARRNLLLGVATILLYVFVPIGILYIATAAGAPIYHVRYLSLYAPLFLLAPAWLVVNAMHLRTWLGALLWAGLLASFALALLAFWTNPLYRADDHRAAVADLAQRWRPGDVILANAGWIYPILTTYWPGGAAGFPTNADPLGTNGSMPPPLLPPRRLSDYTQKAPPVDAERPLVVRSGSVDGSDTLGWGNPESDFFAISAADTLTALDHLAASARRIWHYRLYDTVSDPKGIMRDWFATNTMTSTTAPIPGRDFGQVQLFITQSGAPAAARSALAPVATFGDAVALVAATPPHTVTASSFLYTTLAWQALPALAALPTDLSLSLRLYDENGAAVAQADGPLHDLPTRGWDTTLLHEQVAAIPVPASLAPGMYTLGLVVYRQDNAEALPLTATGGQVWMLGAIEVTPQLAAD
jgi:uncharacterized membrane protein